LGGDIVRDHVICIARINEAEYSSLVTNEFEHADYVRSELPESISRERFQNEKLNIEGGQIEAVTSPRETRPS